VFRLGIIRAIIGTAIGVAGMVFAAYWITTHLS
jgi:hypothetical protein